MVYDRKKSSIFSLIFPVCCPTGLFLCVHEKTPEGLLFFLFFLFFVWSYRVFVDVSYRVFCVCVIQVFVCVSYRVFCV